jgi:hypothetical protein
MNTPELLYYAYGIFPSLLSVVPVFPNSFLQYWISRRCSAIVARHSQNDSPIALLSENKQINCPLISLFHAVMKWAAEIHTSLWDDT